MSRRCDEGTFPRRLDMAVIESSPHPLALESQVQFSPRPQAEISLNPIWNRSERVDKLAAQVVWVTSKDSDNKRSIRNRIRSGLSSSPA